MHADRQPRSIDRRKCCSDVAQCRHVTRRTAGISVRNRQPADSRRRGNPAPSPTVHRRRDSPACSGYFAAQVASAAAAVMKCALDMLAWQCAIQIDNLYLYLYLLSRFITCRQVLITVTLKKSKVFCFCFHVPLKFKPLKVSAECGCKQI